MGRRTKADLEKELAKLRRRVAKLEKSEARLRRAEEALRESEGRFRALIENTRDIPYAVDTEGVLTYLGPQAERYGISPDEAVGKSFLEFVTAEDRERTARDYQRTVQTGEEFPTEFRVEGKDGQVHWLGDRGKVLKDNSGKVVGLTGDLRDITERKRADEALRASEERYREMVENIADLVQSVAPDGSILYVNRAWRETLGYSNEEVSSLSLFDVIHPDSQARCRELFQRVLSGEKLKGFEAKFVAKDSRSILLEGSASCRFVDGKPAATHGILHDITERKRAEEALRESEERFRTLCEWAPIGIFLSDAEGRGTYANPRWQAITGQPIEETLSGRWSQAIHPDDRATVLEEWSRATREGREFSREMRLLGPQGEEHRVYVQAVRMLSEGATPTGYVGIVEDITQRKRAEEALRQSEEKYSTLVEKGNDGIVIIQDGVLRFLNSKMVEMTGWSSEEGVGKPLLDFIAPEYRELVKERYEKRIAGEAPPSNYEVVIVSKDGERVPVEVNATLIDYQGELADMAIVRDIRDRKRAEVEKEALQAQFLQAQKMEAVGRLAGGVAHDFNNLMTIVTGYSALMLKDLREDDPIRADLEGIRRAGEKAAGLTRQLLAFSRRQILQPKVLALNGLVSDMEKMLRRLIGEDIELVTDLGAGLGKVKADPGQVEQIVMNLAVNARDAMPKGGKLTIETANAELDEEYVRQHAGARPGSYVRLSLEDTGHGMDEKTLSHIFEPFFTTKEEGKGTGLGLATVYGIVKQHDGYISVESEPGQGTRMDIHLPGMEDLAGEEGPDAAFSVAPRGTETILLVEDEEVVRKVASRMLWKSGYKVLEASGGKEALTTCKGHGGSIDLMITDVVMPGMSGRELADRIAELHPGMKVLYMSGYTDNAIVHRGVLEPGTPFLGKPFTPDDLARKVREVLDAPPEGEQ